MKSVIGVHRFGFLQPPSSVHNTKIRPQPLAQLGVRNTSQSQKVHRRLGLRSLLRRPSSVHKTKIRPGSLAPWRVRNTCQSRKIHRRSCVRSLLRPPSSVHKTKIRPRSLAPLRVRNLLRLPSSIQKSRPPPQYLIFSTKCSIFKILPHR